MVYFHVVATAAALTGLTSASQPCYPTNSYREGYILLGVTPSGSFVDLYDIDCDAGFNGVPRYDGDAVQCINGVYNGGHLVGCGDCVPFFQGGYKLVAGIAPSLAHLATVDPSLYVCRDGYTGVPTQDPKGPPLCSRGKYVRSLVGCEPDCSALNGIFGVLRAGLAISTGSHSLAVGTTVTVDASSFMCATGYGTGGTLTGPGYSVTCKLVDFAARWVASAALAAALPSLCLAPSPVIGAPTCPPLLVHGYVPTPLCVGCGVARVPVGTEVPGPSHVCDTARGFALRSGYTAVRGHARCEDGGRWLTQFAGCELGCSLSGPMDGYVYSAAGAATGCASTHTAVGTVAGSVVCSFGHRVHATVASGCVRTTCALSELPLPATMRVDTAASVAVGLSAASVAASIICRDDYDTGYTGAALVNCTPAGWDVWLPTPGTVGGQQHALSGCSVKSSGGVPVTCDITRLPLPAGYIATYNTAGHVVGGVCDAGWHGVVTSFPTCTSGAWGAAWGGCEAVSCQDGWVLTKCGALGQCRGRADQLCAHISPTMSCCRDAAVSDVQAVLLITREAVSPPDGFRFGTDVQFGGGDRFVVVQPGHSLEGGLAEEFAALPDGTVAHVGTLKGAYKGVGVHGDDFTGAYAAGGPLNGAPAVTSVAFAGRTRVTAVGRSGAQVSDAATGTALVFDDDNDRYGLLIDTFNVASEGAALGQPYPQLTHVYGPTHLLASGDAVVVPMYSASADGSRTRLHLLSYRRVNGRFARADAFWQWAAMQDPPPTVFDRGAVMANERRRIAFDGSYIFVGAPSDTVELSFPFAIYPIPTPRRGSVYIFQLAHDGTVDRTFGARQPLTVPGQAFALLRPPGDVAMEYGHSVAVCGGILAVGAPGMRHYRRGVWNAARDNAPTYAPVSVDVAAQWAVHAHGDVGAVIIHRRVGAVWGGVEAVVSPPDGTPDAYGMRFGEAVAVGASGGSHTLFVSGFVNTTQRGALLPGELRWSGSDRNLAVFVYHRYAVATACSSPPCEAAYEWRATLVYVPRDLETSGAPVLATRDGTSVVIGLTSERGNYADDVGNVRYSRGTPTGAVRGAALYLSNVAAQPRSCSVPPPMRHATVVSGARCVAGAPHGTSCGAEDVTCDAAGGHCRATGRVQCIDGTWEGLVACELCLCAPPRLPPALSAVANASGCAGVPHGYVCALSCKAPLCGQPTARALRCHVTQSAATWVTLAGDPPSTLSPDFGCTVCTNDRCALDTLPAPPGAARFAYPTGYANTGTSVHVPCHGGACSPALPPYQEYSCTAGVLVPGAACAPCAECGGAVPFAFQPKASGTFTISAAPIGTTVSPQCAAGASVCSPPRGTLYCGTDLSWHLAEPVDGCAICKHCATADAASHLQGHIVHNGTVEFYPHGSTAILSSRCNPFCLQSGPGSIEATCTNGRWSVQDPPSFTCQC